MGDTDILVDSDTMDQKLEEKVSSDNCKGGDLRDSADETNVPDGQGDQKLEKVILLPEGNALQFKSVKIEVEKSESTDGVSTGWYVLSVMAATCCILPFTLIRDHWKKSRANNLRMKKGYRMTILTLSMGVIILTIFGLLVLGIDCYNNQGSLVGWYYPSEMQQDLDQISDQLSTNKNETVQSNRILINLLRQLNEVTRTTPAYNRYDSKDPISW